MKQTELGSLSSSVVVPGMLTYLARHRKLQRSTEDLTDMTKLLHHTAVILLVDIDHDMTTMMRMYVVHLEHFGILIGVRQDWKFAAWAFSLLTEFGGEDLSRRLHRCNKQS